MTDQELRDLVAENASAIKELKEAQKKTEEAIAATAIQQKKTEIQLAKTDAQLAKTDAQLAATAVQQKKTEIQLAKTDATFGKYFGNEGRRYEDDVTESIKENDMQVHGIKFDILLQNEKDRTNKDFDITLYNGKYCMCLKVKLTLHLNDVKKFLNEGIPKYKKFIANDKTYDKHKIIAGMTSRRVNSDALQYAKDHGIIILAGTNILNITEKTADITPVIF